MQQNKLVVGGVVLALLLGAYGTFFGGSTETVVRETVRELGASAGPEHLVRQYFKAGFQYSCPRTATSSTAATFTLTSSEITFDNCYLDWTANVNTTLTTMATTSMPWLGATAGDTREFWLRNASSTAASTITLAAGTGVDHQKNEDTADLAINGLDVAKLTFIRKANSDVLLIVEEFIEAD